MSEEATGWVDVGYLLTVDGLTDDVTVLQAAADLAGTVMHALSGRRWSVSRTSTLRASGRQQTTGFQSPFGSRCHSNVLDPQVDGPITAVSAITIGAVIVDPARVDIVDGHLLRLPAGDAAVDPLAVNRWPVWRGAYAVWPAGDCSCGGPTFADVTLVYGDAPPAAGQLAARALAVEMAKGMSGQECALPGNVVSVNRQGVSVLLDPSPIYSERRTGIPAADLWLSAVNPDRLTAPPGLWWPEQSSVEHVLTL